MLSEIDAALDKWSTMKTVILPRQARDKQRQSAHSEKDLFFES